LDGIVGILSFAVDGLTQQQQAIANNLANAQTPGFVARDVSFQASLRQAMANPNGGTAAISASADPAPVATDGNNVDTGTQLVAAEKNTLEYQTTVEMLNAQFRLIQGATGGSFA
jgi:flagellar basal-body rod protein FlgB